MLLVADIGNTNITLGIYQGSTLIETWNLASDKNKTEDEYGLNLLNLINHKIKGASIDSAVISSVVPSLTEKFRTAVEKYLDSSVLVITSKTKTGIILDVENPKEVGCDRIANACAAYNLYKAPVVVVDFGTATNFDIVTFEGKFIGGIIAPGLKISAESFSSFTNLLPKLKLEEINSVIGKNTIKNMLSGVVVGHAAMIDGLIRRIEEEMQTSVTTIATGGFSSIVTKHMERPFDHFNKNLTLEGLRLIYELNNTKLQSI
ncbi:MAG TPA: type III pantothenate kinase [Candidatus Gastranaerophilales bacterium]|nr:type III pantothenate kinase [Candidatus Gastranaerophilales bacterium]